MARIKNVSMRMDLAEYALLEELMQAFPKLSKTEIMVKAIKLLHQQECKDEIEKMREILGI